jgi:hypothetical protein
MAGYSGTQLPQKLGIKEDARVGVSNAPAAFTKTLAPLPSGVRITELDDAETYDVLVAFFRSADELANRLRAIAKRLTPAGGLWIAWPKKASGVATDLTEDVVRDRALEAGLVDNKVCAIDETWSGLRLVYRLKDRAAVAARSAVARQGGAPERAIVPGRRKSPTKKTVRNKSTAVEKSIRRRR